MTPIADPEDMSLAIDAPAIGAAALKVGTRNDGMRAYIAAIRAVPIGPQPMIIGGQKSGEYDPLAKQDAFKNALRSAQGGANEMAGRLDTLHLWATGGARRLADEVIDPLQRVQDLVRGDSVTAEQAQEIGRQMGTAYVHTMMLAMALAQAGQGVAAFLARLVQDHDTLSRGPLELRKVADDVRRNIAADAQPYLINPITAGIGKTYIDIGNAALSAIERLAGAIGRALEGHESMQAGASALGVAMVSARGKYEAAYNAAARASPADLPNVMRRFRLSTAITSWNQFADFFTRSGL
jgi:hypothetical protein